MGITIHNWDKCPVTYLTLFAVADGVEGKDRADWVSPGDQIGQFVSGSTPVPVREHQIEFIDLNGAGVAGGQSLGGFTLSGTAKAQKMRYMLIATCRDLSQKELDDLRGDPSRMSDVGKSFVDSILGPDHTG